MEKQNIKQLLNFSIINIDKPCGPTSFSVSDYVRKRFSQVGFDIGKTSHFGTLDPAVSGVLPIALGRGCKLTGFFLGHDKTYVGIIHTHKEQELNELQEIINKNFLGKIKQLPPIKSRVKRAIREREVKRFELLEESEDKKNFLFIAEVEGGTYIRKLCSDLGEMIGGAHMLELRRIQAGIFNENTSVNLYEFDKAIDELKKGNEKPLKEMLILGENAIKQVIESTQLSKTASLKQLLTGKPLFSQDLLKLPKNELFSVFSKERFVGIYKKSKENQIFARAEFVYT